MEEKLKLLMGKVFDVSPTTITPESGPYTISRWDSAGHMRLVLELEEQFGVRFQDDEVAELVNFECILTLLQKHEARVAHGISISTCAA